MVSCKSLICMIDVSRVVQLFKGISARRLFQEFPQIRVNPQIHGTPFATLSQMRVRRRLWGGHLWSRGISICDLIANGILETLLSFGTSFASANACPMNLSIHEEVLPLCRQSCKSFDLQDTVCDLVANACPQSRGGTCEAKRFPNHFMRFRFIGNGVL